MQGKTLINIEKPTTQSIEAVKSLLSWRGRASNPLPSYVELGEGDNRLVLVLSNKKDAFYTVTARDCSCPAHNWHPGQRCKHQRKHFPEEQTTTKPTAIIMERKPFKPFLEDELRPAKVSAPLSVIDCHDSSDMDAAYFSIKHDREMWPACEA